MRTVLPMSGAPPPLSFRLKSPADFLNCVASLVSPLAAAAGSPNVVPERPGHGSTHALARLGCCGAGAPYISSVRL